MTTELSRMTGYRISCEDCEPITVTRDYDGTIRIDQGDEGDGCLLLTDVAASLLAKALGDLTADAPAAAEPAPAKPPRLDIAQAVLGFLTKNGGTVVRDIATALDRKPSQIEAAIGRLGDKVAQHDDGSYGLVSEPAGERVA